jgi:hypothetical protein
MMVMDNKKLSQIIRAKKKAMLEADPGITDTSPVPDMNAQDIMDAHDAASVESTLNSPEKINADRTSLADPNDLNMGLNEDEKKRMGRLRTYMDSLSMDE